MSPETITAIFTALAAVLGTQGALKFVEVWGNRRKDGVAAELSLSGGWEALYSKTSDRVAALEAELKLTREEVARLVVENARLHVENEHLSAALQTVKDRVAQLESQ